jgi:hypothetical protein
MPLHIDPQQANLHVAEDGGQMESQILKTTVSSLIEP